MTKKNLLLALLFALFVSLPIMAQDAIVTDEPAATQEATVTEVPTETATPAPEATAVEIDINVDVTDGTDGTGSTGETGGDGTGNPLYYLAIAVLLIVLAFGMLDRWTNYKLSKTAISQVPPEWMPFILKGVETAQKVGYEKAGTLVSGTLGVWDDNLLNEQMKNAGWEFYIDPATGAQHARKTVDPMAPAARG